MARSGDVVVDYWRVPRMWEGRTAAVCASGASMSCEVAEAIRCAGLPTIVTNNTFRLAPWADILYAADPEWWAHPSNADAKKFGGLCVSVSAVDGVLRLRNSGTEGFDDDAGALRTGSNSGYQALHLAMHTGARRILLCGYNMTGGHWHGRHVEGLREAPEEYYVRFRAKFDGLVGPARALGVEIVNVTPDSALESFPRGALEDELWRAH